MLITVKVLDYQNYLIFITLILLIKWLASG